MTLSVPLSRVLSFGPGWLSLVGRLQHAYQNMKDATGLIIAILFSGLGASWVLFPQWAYRVVTPEQAARDRKRFRTFGFVLLPVGVILLLLHFL